MSNDYNRKLTQYITSQMKSKTKLHFKDVVAEVTKWVLDAYPKLTTQQAKKMASTTFDEYRTEQAEYKNMDDDLGYYIYPSSSDRVIFSNAYNTFIQRQKPLSDKGGKFIVVLSGSGKPGKLYGV